MSNENKGRKTRSQSARKLNAGATELSEITNGMSKVGLADQAGKTHFSLKSISPKRSGEDKGVAYDTACRALDVLRETGRLAKVIPNTEAFIIEMNNCSQLYSFSVTLQNKQAFRDSLKSVVFYNWYIKNFEARYQGMFKLG